MQRLTIVVALLSACGSSGTGSPPVDVACGDLAMARCTKRMTCTGGAGITRAFGDMTTCLAREKLQCTIGLAAPMTGNSTALVEQCVTALGGTSCEDFLFNNPPAACIPSGPRANGSPCAFFGQCASTYCANNKNAVCGTCGGAPAAGSSCAATNCERGQECVAATNLCQVPGASGASCGAGLPCGADLGCVGAMGTTMGTCQTASSTAGTACGGTMPPCDGTRGFFCGGMTGSKTCMVITYVGDGMPCGTVTAGTFVGCSSGGNCYNAAGMIAAAGEMGTCKAAAGDGAPCDNASGPPCMLPARCVATGGGTAGTCVVPDGTMCM